jgi:hypothetical protein
VNTPILLMLYKRPETTIHVINALRKIKAKYLYISISIPKAKKNSQDFVKYKEVFKIIKSIDWNCKIKLRNKINIDPYTSWDLAIKWFFKNVKEGIILEDDVVPNKSFFIFCSKLLKKYRYNDKIAQICGTSFINQKNISNESYIFSNYSLGWGWATWRRSILDYDEKMKDWPQIKKKKKLLKICNDQFFLNYWTRIFDTQYKNKFKAWDERWLYSNWKKNKLSIIPKKHLVKNIGFGKSATHTKIKHWYANLETNELKYKNKHPKNIIANLGYDKWLNSNVFGIQFNDIKHKLIKHKILRSKVIYGIIKIIYKMIKPIYRIIKPIY